MATYIKLNSQQLLNFANGTTIDGQSVTASSPIVQSEADALTYLYGRGYTIAWIIGYGGMKEYLLYQSGNSSVNFLLLNQAQLINFANGTTIDGQSITASNPIVQSEADALTYIISQNYTLVWIIGFGAGTEYLIG